MANDSDKLKKIFTEAAVGAAAGAVIAIPVPFIGPAAGFVIGGVAGAIHAIKKNP